MGEVVKHEKSRDVAAIEMGANGALMPKNFEGLWRLSTIMAASGAMPKDCQTVESVFVRVQYGLELGLSPMQAVQSIASINGRPSIWGDAVIGLVEASGKLEKMEEYFENEAPNFPDNMAAVCYAKKVTGREVTQKFSVADAKRAGLWGKQGPWANFTRRMLQMRARGFCLRDLFPEVLKGLYTSEEAMDMVQVNGTYQAAAQPLPTGDNSELYKPKKVESEQKTESPAPAASQKTAAQQFDELASAKTDDPFSGQLPDYLDYCAEKTGKTVNQVIAAAIDNFDKFWKFFELWTEAKEAKDAEAKNPTEQKNNGTEEDPQARWDNHFRQKWVNLRKPGFADFVYKNRPDFLQSSEALKAEALAKWQGFYPENPAPKCLLPSQDGTTPPVEQKQENAEQPGETDNLADNPEYKDYLQSSEIDPGLMCNARRKVFGTDREPTDLNEIRNVIRVFNELVDLKNGPKF